MNDLTDIKIKMNKEGFEYVANIPCYGIDFVVSGTYYLFAKPIGHALYFKVVDSNSEEYEIDLITPQKVKFYYDFHDVNAKFTKHDDEYFFKMPTILSQYR